MNSVKKKSIDFFIREDWMSGGFSDAQLDNIIRDKVHPTKRKK